MLLKRSGFGLFIALAIALPGYATTGPYMNTSIGYAALQGPKKLNLRDTIQYSFDQEQHTPLLRFGTGWLFFENFGLEIGYAHLFSKKYQTYVAKSQTSQDNLDIMAVWNVPLSTMFEAKLGVGGSYKQTHYNLDSHLLHKLNTTRSGWVQTFTIGADCYLTRYVGLGLGYQWWGKQNNDIEGFNDTTYFVTGASSSWLLTTTYRFL